MPHRIRRPTSLARSAAILGAIAAAAGVSAARAQLSTEAAFLQVPSASGARESSQVINRRAHYPGTPGDYRLAVYMRDAMRKFGLRSWLETLTATVYTPRLLQLQLLTSPVVTFDLRDRPIAADPDGSRPDSGVPFNAGSGNGDVRASLVYVSRGLEPDYATLARGAVSVAGKIVLVRYGAEYRGNLAARAQQHGAAGVIFYSDPRDGGFTKGPAYPNGPYRPLGAVQRGDVMADDNLPLRIPTLPVTAYTAQRLLADMRGGGGPPGWAGALPVTYPVGTTRSLVRLHVEMNAKRTTLWNTIGEIAGNDPQQTVVLGGHRDAWVYGVTDDGSGISTLLEVARGLGALHRAGWTPKRTIRIAGWDGEEIGELGSSAYVAAHRSELQQGCIAYLNTDEAASGPILGAAAAGALLPAVQAALGEVLHDSNVHIDAPAGGSDFESFIYTTGTPVLDLGYSGPFGTYHSPYDDFRFASLYADPGFVHHRAIAQTIGLVAIRIADAGAGIYRFAPYASVLDQGVKSVAAAAAKAKLTLDPALDNAVDRFARAASSYDSATHPHDAGKALAAVQALDLLAYSANGYASVAFPRIATALASGSQKAVDAAVASTGAELQRVSALLAQ
jgi:N-acetylated-alpha-linked acidic dipeptidase